MSTISVNHVNMVRIISLFQRPKWKIFLCCSISSWKNQSILSQVFHFPILQHIFVVCALLFAKWIKTQNIVFTFIWAASRIAGPLPERNVPIKLQMTCPKCKTEYCIAWNKAFNPYYSFFSNWYMRTPSGQFYSVFFFYKLPSILCKTIKIEWDVPFYDQKTKFDWVH